MIHEIWITPCRKSPRSVLDQGFWIKGSGYNKIFHDSGSVLDSATNFNVALIAVSCGYDTWFAVRLVMDYTISRFA